ncbi:uncharacterized protein LOC124138998 [Haliotis rufescens]|uniref:uncharacterized protein LOC124138998 n=1 Tax=Haliotis rufescens TaxID=6454 RepID=UPI00201F4E7C|nr:uncharacterized protein LOC124138998 [Haliotis rufescens]
MTAAIIAIVLSLCLHSMVLGHEMETKQVCTSNSSTTFNLSCSEQEMLYFASLDIRNMTDNCERGSCSSGYSSTDDVQCMGVSSCEKTVNKSMIQTLCESVIKYQPTISYECIHGTPVDICTTTGVVSGDDMMLHLASPNFPGNSNSTDTNKTCTCDLAGSDMTVQILVGKYGNRDPDTEKFNLTSGSETYLPTVPNSTIAHLILGVEAMKNKNSITLNYNTIEKEGKDGDYVWLRVKGSSYLTVACNGANPPSTPAPPSTTTDVTSGTTQPGGIPMVTVASVCSALFAAMIFTAV